MQLDYNILWIDDDLSYYIERGAIENLKEYIYSDLGFMPNVVTITEAAGFEIDQDESKYDLIISDYNLGDDSNTGVQVVEKIREHCLTEILFYTGNISADIEATLRTALINIDRITIHIGRDSLIEKIQELIQLSVQKLLELNATRGLITALTSELDVDIKEITLYLIRKKLDKKQEDLDWIINQYVDDFLKKGPDRFNAKYQEIGFDSLFHSIESNRKWRIFRNLMKEYGKQDTDQIITDFLYANKTYFEQVIDIRNKFAHAKEEEKDGRLVLMGQYGKEDFEFDNEKCIEIRKNLIQHKKNFEELIEYFKI